MGTALPRSSVDRIPTGIASCLYFIHMAVISLHNHYFISPFKMHDRKNSQNKIRKKPPTAGCQPQPIPLNAARKGYKLSWQCSIFKRRIAISPLAPDRVSFLGTRGFPYFRSGSSLCFAIGGCGINQGLSPHRYVLY